MHWIMTGGLRRINGVNYFPTNCTIRVTGPPREYQQSHRRDQLSEPRLPGKYTYFTRLAETLLLELNYNLLYYKETLIVY